MEAAEQDMPVSNEKDAGKEQDIDDDEDKQEIASQDSSDDEADYKLPTMVERDNDDKPFTFYSFGFHLVPFHDIMQSFYTMRQTFRHSKTSKASDAGLGSRTKSFDIKEFQRTKELQSQQAKTHKISRFRPVEAKWDGTHMLDKDILANLYRTPQNDPSGKVIFSVLRDEAKGVAAWKGTERDRDLPAPTLDKCNPRLQEQVLAHMNEAIAKVEKEYAKTPSKTQHESTLKAQMGADLDNLRRQRDELQHHLRTAAKRK